MPKLVNAQLAREIVSSVEYVLLDIDGVVWSGANIIEGVPETLNYLRAQGKKIRFMTNNASLSRRELQNMLVHRGIPGVTAEEVYNSAFASALKLRQLLGKPTAPRAHRDAVTPAHTGVDNAAQTHLAKEDHGNRSGDDDHVKDETNSSTWKVHGNVFVIGERGLHDEIQAVLAPGYVTYGTELHDMTSLGGYNAIRVASAWRERMMPYPYKWIPSAKKDDDDDAEEEEDGDEAMWGGGQRTSGSHAFLYNRNNEQESMPTSVANDNHITVNSHELNSREEHDDDNNNNNSNNENRLHASQRDDHLHINDDNHNNSNNNSKENSRSRSSKNSSDKVHYSHVESDFSMCNQHAQGISLTDLNPVAVVVGLDLHFNILKLSYAAMILQGPPTPAAVSDPHNEAKYLVHVDDSSKTESRASASTMSAEAGGRRANAARALFIATNEDPQVPIGKDGILFPGAGVMVGSLQTTSNRAPDAVCGKPFADMATTLFAAEGITEPSKSCLMVGDRLTTDVAFGYRAGCARMFVLSGVEKQADVDAAERSGATELIPDYIAHSLAALLPHEG